MTIEQITTERDAYKAQLIRVRAALEAVLPIAERYRPKPDLEYAACCELGHAALANTSPAPTESVNKELLDALKEARDALNGAPNTVGLHSQIDAAIANSEKAGG